MRQVSEEEEENKPLELRPYQEIGCDWLCDKKRAFLTDYPGLGKTLQASEAAVRPVLVTAPSYLTEQWSEHLHRQYPNDRIVLATGTIDRFKRQKRLNRRADWYIVNHEMMRSFTMPEVKTVIVDECHHFRNRNALKTKGLAKYTQDEGLRVYMLSASPMWKGPEDIWAQLNILQPDLFRSYHEFIDTFMITDNTPWGQKVLGVKKSNRKILDGMLSILKFGRTYADVGRTLPESIKTSIKVDMPPRLYEKYEEMRDFYRLELEEEGEIEIFSSYIAVLHSLRAFTNFPDKQEALVSRLEDVGKPALIFVWYKDTADSIHKLIKNSVMLTGDMSPAERLEQANKAQHSGKTIVATLSSLGEGVNLQKYRHVIFYETDWTPGRNFQALSRVVRDRNDSGLDTEPVLVDYIYVSKTVDQVIYKMAQCREASIKDVMREVLL